MRSGDWKYLSVEGDEFLFNLAKDERERANYGKRDPARLAGDAREVPGLGRIAAEAPRRRLLRAGHQGRHGHALQLAGRYSITRSARSTRLCGNARPMAFAVRMLRSSSMSRACSTGRSAGFAPRSTRAT